ncbi:hypothetical protein [Luteimonas kalidii]|uniref:Uncharacterized protein n=1 Tax=Luteimonas kalidii TaxID=3042025 RepID=A0ABT6JS23_9GAMM|nr:hypothetical protein [Luteimonas kalidii]MDH5833486.1 hypothetical protein [Luteimonas kalidii]
MSDLPVTGEVSNSKLAAVFGSRDAARDAATALVAELGLQPAQVKLVTPDSADVDIQLEPEGGGIWHTIVVAHVRLGIAGAVVGLLAFLALYWAGIPFVVQSPWVAGLAGTGFGAIAGLLLGGLVSLRPDHDRYIQATRSAIDEGRTTLVLHALSAEQNTRAAAFLSRRGAAVTRTL